MKNQQGAPEALRVEAAYGDDGKFIGYRLLSSGANGGLLVWADQKAMPGFRIGDHFVPGYREVIDYKPVALVEAQQTAAHVQNPAEIEHVAGDVSKNGSESNMAQQPAPLQPVEQRGVTHAEPPGSREDQMVVISRDASGTPTIWCDPEIAPIVTALNAAGVKTVASCSGHGNAPSVISLADGRAVVIARDSIECESMTRVRGCDVNGAPLPPKGYVWMPTTPTLEMLDALRANTTYRLDQRYSNLLAAASNGQAQAAQEDKPSPTPQADSQPAPGLDMAVMQLAESVGLIGPGSRVHDLHAAIQRFHDLICVNATIKAAVMAADVIRGAATSVRDYPPLPMQFACSGVFPVYSADQMRAYVDADRAARAPADSVTAPAGGGVVGWLPVHFNGHGFYGGPLKTEAEANQYIAQVHQSNDSVTLIARPFAWATATSTTSVRAEALRLAEALDLYAAGDEHQRDIEDAAAELRRLHATQTAQAADSVLEDAARLLRQILAASQDGDSDTHLSAHFVSRIETITKAGGAA